MVVEPSPNVSRTIKLLVAVSVCDIVTPEWVDACRAADQFVPVDAYLLGECAVSSKAPRERQSGERWVERRGARERRAERGGSARERAERMPTDASEAGPLGLDAPAPAAPQGVKVPWDAAKARTRAAAAPCLRGRTFYITKTTSPDADKLKVIIGKARERPAGASRLSPSAERGCVTWL